MLLKVNEKKGIMSCDINEVDDLDKALLTTSDVSP